jgi:S1-C subfamily serine protease
MAGAVLIAAMAWLLAVGVPVVSDAATETELQSAVFRAKPAVVMIAVRIGATATVRCSDGATAVVRPGSIGELGSGSIIHPDGWIVTNGHVVQPYQEGADGAFAVELLEKAVAAACVAELDGLPDAARTGASARSPRAPRTVAASPSSGRSMSTFRMASPTPRR